MNYLILLTYLIMNINKGVDYMCNDNTNNCNSCIADILKVILILQESVCGNDSCLQTCDRGFLGQNATSFYNTRPIVLYTCGSNGTPLALPISRDPAETTTSTVCAQKLAGEILSTSTRITQSIMSASEKTLSRLIRCLIMQTVFTTLMNTCTCTEKTKAA